MTVIAIKLCYRMILKKYFDKKEKEKMFPKAIKNVRKVYRRGELYDFTDVNEYISEYITGVFLSAPNYESLVE